MSLSPHEAVADLELATRVSVGACDCSVHLHLFREDGSLFAGAAMPPELAERIAASMLRAAVIVRDSDASRESH
jgi:hypothetical protein